MLVLFKVFLESIRQAFGQLTANKLRSFLSLLGITIGIFCIIGVKAAVDSLEDNVKGSFEKLGSDVVYVSKFSWAEDPGGNWWTWIRRPVPDMDDYEVLNEKLRSAEMVSYQVGFGSRTLKYKSNSLDRANMQAISFEHAAMYKLELEKGRYFTPLEHRMGHAKIVIGATIAKELFDRIEPIGKKIKVAGRKMEVIGVLKKGGDDPFSIMNYDEIVLMSFTYAKNFVNLRNRYLFDSSVTAKAVKGIPLTELKDEMTGVLRAHRRLKPREESNFALNEVTMINQLLDGFFSVLNLAGFIIGIFAILVGMFSVANIMFVSVKERTGMIGIKKALGAKRGVILLEFLIEAILLCVIGGVVGLLFIHGIVTIISKAVGFSLYLSAENMFIGVTLSVIVGIIAGVIPALSAARMDPVEAMRH